MFMVYYRFAATEVFMGKDEVFRLIVLNRQSTRMHANVFIRVNSRLFAVKE
jgi:hypothetical protein